MDWIIAHWAVIGTVLGAVWGFWKHRQAGQTAGALTAVIQGVESLDSKGLKNSIQTIAATAGVQGVLDGFVQQVTKDGAP